MLSNLKAIVRNGRIELLEDAELPEGASVIVTVVSDGESQFWLGASQSALDSIWNNSEDDVYARLLEK